MPKIRYKGPSSIRQISPAQFEHEGVTDHGYEADSEGLVIDTLNGGVGFPLDSRERVIDVPDTVAALLTSREPEQWELLDDTEAQEVEAAEAAEAAAEQARLDAIQAEKDEIAANAARAEAENPPDPDPDE